MSRFGDEGGSYTGDRGEIYYYHSDPLGSSNYITDTRGSEYEHLEYMPYGEVWVEEGRDSLERIDYLFTGKEYDKETGLYYFGARYLDPQTSRWISVDPAVEEYLPLAPIVDAACRQNGNLPGMGGVFSPVNLVVYHYGGNNPLKYVDPDGCFNIYTGKIEYSDTSKTNQINEFYNTRFTVDEIADINGIIDKNKIYVGQFIYLPNTTELFIKLCEKI